MAILAGMWFQQMHPAWQKALADQTDLLNQLESQVADLPNLCPRSDIVMAAFAQDPAAVSVVIIGQDPYPTEGVAVGRAFAVSQPPAPASLRNILLELQSDLGVEFSTDSEPSLFDFGATVSSPKFDLSGWQEQGVMLLNRHLTTVVGEPGAHFKLGWTAFTDAVVAHLIRSNPLTVLVLWGAQAQQLTQSLAGEISAAGDRVRVIEGVHPSPLSARRGFFGSRPFSGINSVLQSRGLQQINWLQ